MPYLQTVQRVTRAVHDTFEEIYPWFGKPNEVLRYRPSDGGWSIEEILEHITLTSHFLLIVAHNGCTKAIKRAQTQRIEDTESDLARLGAIGQKGSFSWIRPEHMEPKGKTASEVLVTMRTQQQHCETILQKLSNGEGSLFKVNMSVNKLGRIDLYEWIYFIAQHAKRHVTQMEENLSEWQQKS
jgi:DinB superfamily